ncbi:MAG: hypothetical protein AMJ46_11305 [Latescibacteria bacterium DG_63]|nr:MAG: hypothetical protein AMJ46_11305 [Latescibacteria bacterium DG_63]
MRHPRLGQRVSPLPRHRIWPCRTQRQSPACRLPGQRTYSSSVFLQVATAKDATPPAARNPPTCASPSRRTERFSVG